MRGLAATLLLALLLGVATHAEAQSIGELYTLCTFYPQPGTCGPVYERAAKDTHPAAPMALATYRNYVRYLKPGDLSAADRQYLVANQVDLPDSLKPAELGGLSAVINDPALADPQAKLRAVRAFLGRAVQAHIYCVLHDCNAPPTSSSAPLPPALGS